MHAARLSSPRLRRVLRVLSDGRPHSTMEIVRRARVMAVSACVAELRARGARVACVQVIEGGVRRWEYTMTAPPPRGGDAS